MKEYPKITKISKNSPQNNSETATNDYLKERYIFLEKGQKSIDEL